MTMKYIFGHGMVTVPVIVTVMKFFYDHYNFSRLITNRYQPYYCYYINHIFVDAMTAFF